jgi:hypothetical protein
MGIDRAGSFDLITRGSCPEIGPTSLGPDRGPGLTEVDGGSGGGSGCWIFAPVRGSINGVPKHTPGILAASVVDAGGESVSIGGTSDAAKVGVGDGL